MWWIHVGVDYLRHLIQAKKPSQLHSPYLFDLLTFVHDRNRKYYAFEVIERHRRELRGDRSKITVHDMGAGSRISGTAKTRRVSAIARRALASPRRCERYFRLATYLKATTIVEIGTSLGISTAYLAAACGSGYVYGLEGATEVLKKAQQTADRFHLHNLHLIPGHFDQSLPAVLQEIPYPDLILIDGNHQYAATMRYFELVKHHRNPSTIIVVDDIRWSREMHQAWQEIQNDPDVTVSLDCFSYGIVFFRKEFRERIALKIATW